MEKNKEGNAEKFFKDFGKKVDQFVVELNEANDRLKKDFEGKYEDLKKTKDNLKKEVKNKERWKDVEQSLKKAGNELEKAFKAAFQKQKKKKAKTKSDTKTKTKSTAKAKTSSKTKAKKKSSK
ncbi:MAG: hypothetical protein WAU36_10440 [Cyclobacteriaceae bacterium]